MGSELNIVVRPAANPDQVVVNGSLGEVKVFSLMIPKDQWAGWASAMASGNMTVDESELS